MSDPGKFSFDAGALCLDFANTCGDRPTGNEEKLERADDLLGWGTEAGLVSSTELDRIRGGSGGDEETFHNAIELREAIYASCSALAEGRIPRRNDLTKINAVLKNALPNLELGIRGDGCCWEWAAASTASNRILWPVARSVADLLTSNDSSRLRECAGDGCSWLFLDTSRNKRRKWCSMSSCGNRAKARRHYARTKADP